VEAIGDGCGACDIRRDLRLYLILCTRYLTGNSDWMTEEGLLFDVMLVSFPSPAVLVAVISKIASDISPYHTLTSYSEMGYGIAGYRSLS
jgi:hypothetical protein